MFKHAKAEVEITWVNFHAYCPNDCPQQHLCGHCVQTYPIAIAVCMVVPQIACGGTEIVVLRGEPLSLIRGSTITNWHVLVVATVKYMGV